MASFVSSNQSLPRGVRKYTIVGDSDVIGCIVTVVGDSGLFAMKPLVIVCLLAAIGTRDASKRKSK